MKRLLTICLVATVCVLGMSAQSIYDIKVKDDAGKDASLSDYKGKVLLIVNTATRCGFTPQYKELEALYEKYQKEGLEILDFPCNQFGEQAPGSIQEIHQFCTASFGGFHLTDKTGQFMDQMLRKKDADYDKKADIKWNFTKFLVSRDGRVVKRYEPTEKISVIEADIEALL